jgi:hypothetical protein
MTTGRSDASTECCSGELPHVNAESDIGVGVGGLAEAVDGPATGPGDNAGTCNVLLEGISSISGSWWALVDAGIREGDIEVCGDPLGIEADGRVW